MAANLPVIGLPVDDADKAARMRWSERVAFEAFDMLLSGLPCTDCGAELKRGDMAWFRSACPIRTSLSETVCIPCARKEFLPGETF